MNWESTCDLTDVSASICDKKRGRPYDTVPDILLFLSLAQSLLKGQTAPIWCQRESTHITLSGTDDKQSLIQICIPEIFLNLRSTDKNWKVIYPVFFQASLEIVADPLANEKLFYPEWILSEYQVLFKCFILFIILKHCI